MKIAIALLILSLIVLAGCAVQEAAKDTTNQVTEEITAEDTAAEADPMLLDEEEDMEIGEML